jgi:hypothetical protein
MSRKSESPIQPGARTAPVLLTSTHSLFPLNRELNRQLIPRHRRIPLTHALQNPRDLYRIRTGRPRRKVLLRSQRGNLLRDRDINKLIQRHSFCLGEFTRFVQQRRLQPQCKVASSHDRSPHILSIRIPRQQPQELSWRHNTTTKPGCCRIEISFVESNDRIRLTVDRGLQNHIVIRVRQGRPPAKSKHHTSSYFGQAVEYFPHILYTCPGC